MKGKDVHSRLVRAKNGEKNQGRCPEIAKERVR